MNGKVNYEILHLSELEEALKGLDEDVNPEEVRLIKELIDKGGYKYPPETNRESVETVQSMELASRKDMSQNLIQAILGGPKEPEIARKVVKLTTYVLVITAIISAIFSVAGFFLEGKGQAMQYLLDPWALVDVLISLILAFFIYKLKLWAGIAIVVIQVLSAYLIYTETGHIPSAIVLFKFILFVSACKGIYLLNKQAIESHRHA